MSSDPPAWLRDVDDGAILSIRVGPRARRPGVAGFHGQALRIRVAAPPEGGAANRELVRLLATALGVKIADVGIEAGAGARDKRIRVRGLSAEQIRDRLFVDTPRGHD
jgi:uncharacterized protein (TIGR00251 family)